MKSRSRLERAALAAMAAAALMAGAGVAEAAVRRLPEDVGPRALPDTRARVIETVSRAATSLSTSLTTFFKYMDWGWDSGPDSSQRLPVIRAPRAE